MQDSHMLFNAIVTERHACCIRQLSVIRCCRVVLLFSYVTSVRSWCFYWPPACCCSSRTWNAFVQCKYMRTQNATTKVHMFVERAAPPARGLEVRFPRRSHFYTGTERNGTCVLIEIARISRNPWAIKINSAVPFQFHTS